MGTRDRLGTSLSSSTRDRFARGRFSDPLRRGSSRLLRPSLIALGVLAVLLVCAIVAVRLLIDPERLKETALARVRVATGYEIEAGPAAVRVSWSGVGIGVESFRMASPDSSQTLVVARTDIYVKLLPLLRRQVELRELVLNRPRLSLDETRGTASSGGRRAGDRARGVAGAGSAPALALFAVESWKVEDGALRRRSGDDDLALDGLDLEGGFRWSVGEGGRGTAAGRAASGVFDGAAGRFDLPPVSARVAFSINAVSDSLYLPEVILEAGGLRAILAGAYGLRGGSWVGAMEGRADPADWSRIQPLLPASAESTLAGKDLAGRITLERLRLELAAGGDTRVSGELALDSFEARMAGAPLGLSDGRARVVFAPGRVVLEDGRGRLGDEPLTFAVRLEGDPFRRYRATVATSVTGPVLAGLLPPAARLDLTSGALDLDLELAGDLPPGPDNLPRVDGRVAVNDLVGTLRGLPLREGRGSLLFREGGASVNDLGVHWGASDLLLDGVVPDIAEPKLRFTLAGQLVDLDEIIPSDEGEPGPASGPVGGPPAAEGPPPIVGVPAVGWVEIARLRAHGQEFSNLRVHVDLGLDGLFLTEATAHVNQGNLVGRLDVTPVADGRVWRYDGRATVTGVSVAPLVATWLPAGERIEGVANADVTLSGDLAPGEDMRAGLTVKGDLSLDDGAFINLAALRSVAEALQVKEGMGERWSFRDLWMRFAVRDGRVAVDTLRVRQHGLDWWLGGSVGLSGALDLSGTLRADSRVVSVPPELKLFASYLIESDGRIPLDFRVGGDFKDPQVGLDWAGLAARAAARAKGQESESLRRKMENEATDPEKLDRLRKLVGGKKESAGG